MYYIPIHKKGNAEDPNNPRKISLLTTMSKICAYILNKRLDTFIEDKDIIGEYQGGLKQHSTADNIYILQSLV